MVKKSLGVATMPPLGWKLETHSFGGFWYNLFVKTKALFIIDVQKGFLNKFTKDLPIKIAHFLEKKKEAFDYIFFFKFINKQNSNWTNQLNWYAMFNPPDTDIAIELEKFTINDNVFNKRAFFSAIKADNFLDFLKSKNISEIYICGMDTHACILITTMEAFEMGYNVKVIEDLCFSSHGRKYHKNAIDILKRNLGKAIIIKSSEL